MWKVWIQSWREAPLTMSWLVLALVLSCSAEIAGRTIFDSVSDAQWKLGAAVQLVNTEEPQLAGFFDLWNGELWRVPINVFHHGNVLHLGLNCLGMWYLGRLLEPCFRFWHYFFFLLTAAVVSMLAEISLEHSAVGLSGVAYAIFGALLVARRHDPLIKEKFDDGLVQLGIAWLFVCIVLTATEALAIANAAHFSGFAYGWITGKVFFEKQSFAASQRGAFWFAHLLLLPWFYSTVSPVWLGRYHWYLAEQTQGEARLIHLREAIEREPALKKPWRILAGIQLRRAEPFVAWRTMLECLSYNRTDNDGAKFAKEIWYHFPDTQSRLRARQILADIFGEEEHDWQERLGILPESPLGSPDQNDGQKFDSKAVASDDVERFRLDQKIVLPLTIDGNKELPERRLLAPSVNPDDPHSASRDLSVTL